MGKQGDEEDRRTLNDEVQQQFLQHLFSFLP